MCNVLTFPASAPDRLYGNECNVLAEILLDRYDRFVTHQMLTHLTSNLNRRSA